MNFKMCNIKNTCENTVTNIKSTIEKTKNITVHPKLDASLHIKNHQKEVFGSDLYFNKEISLFKIITVGVCVVAGIALAATVISSLFGSCCDCCNEVEEDK